MNLVLMHCDTLHGGVLVTKDLEGFVSRVICPQYVEETGACRMKMRSHSGGPLSRLLERIDQRALGHATDQCDLHTPT